MNKPLNKIGQDLKQRLIGIKKVEAKHDNQQHVNVANVGRIVAFAYEQLRNSAEYTQEHLLRQRAIRRFLVRNVSLHTKGEPNPAIAEEIIVELTQAGYIENNTVPRTSLAKISASVTKHCANYWQMKSHTTQANAEEWTLDLLSVDIESIIADDQRLQTYQYFAYQHYKGTINKQHYPSTNPDDNYDVSLYIAVHKTLLKSDLATVRHDLQQLYQFPSDNISEYIRFHKNISAAFSSDLTNQLARYVDKHGAPLRILKAMLEENDNLSDVLDNESKFIGAFKTQVDHEYKQAGKRLNKVLLKSIVFLLITKSLIGLLIEIPYDLAVTGSILVVPLLVNLLAPVGYLLIQRLSIKVPGQTNTDAMVDYIKSALYEENPVIAQAKPRSSSYSVGFSIAYAVMFVAAFGIVFNRLISLQFNPVQMVLFVIFLATASFLGFRLTHTVRELELVSAKAGLIQLIRDFLYMPFIVLGRWLSEEYKKVNIIALILDTAIELPLKTVLRLVRQWTKFLDDKKEQL